MNRRGFTLVELLVVIAIIGILVSLLLPAVQAARESARRNQCSNNLKQMALGCLSHERAQGFLPTGGWGWQWVGDPDRGYSNRQPGGWHFNLLCFIEQQPLHDAGLNAKQSGRDTTLQTPVPMFNCPTRRPVMAYPLGGQGWINADVTPTAGRSDYAANGGDEIGESDSWNGPGSLAAGDAMTEAQWEGYSDGANTATGVIFRRSMLQLAQITDGSSNTYLIGERYLDPDYYLTGTGCDDDQGWDQGYDFDTNRWTYYDPNNLGSVMPPMPDTPGYGGCMRNFGSAHAGTFNMAFCDGSVHAISYAVDLETHRRLGNRKDGLVVDQSKY